MDLLRLRPLSAQAVGRQLRRAEKGHIVGNELDCVRRGQSGVHPSEK